MSDRALVRVAKGLFLFTSSMFLGTLLLSFFEGSRTGDPSWGTSGYLANLFFLTTMATFPIVGMLIVGQRPRNPIAWILLAIGLVWAVVGLSDVVVLYLLGTDGPPPVDPYLVVALTEWGWVPGIGLIGTYLLLLFPDGRLPSSRWRKFAWGVGVVLVLTSMSIIFRPGDLADSGYPGIENPLGVEALEPLMGTLDTTLALFPLSILLSAASLVLRYRRSRGQERLQLKWLSTAAATVAGIFVVTMGASLSVGGTGPSDGGALIRLLQDVSLVSFILIPISIGAALLRYRLYDIDLVINRTLVYGLLTAILATAYIALVFGLQSVLAPFAADSDLAIAGSTLAVAALFRPARSRVQAFIDRRFYRSKFDAQRTLEEFSGQLRDQVDLGALSSRLTGIVGETMQPAHISLWIKGAPMTDPVTISER
jgi:uncharacterized membrane protein YidH (DUF202 family)